MIPRVCCFASTRLTHVSHLYPCSFQILTAPLGLTKGFLLGTAVFLVLLSVLECRVAFFIRFPHIIIFSPELETWVTHFSFYYFLLPEDPYCLIYVSLSDLVPSLSVPPIPWLFLVHSVVGCCCLSFPFCRLTRGIPATFFLGSSFCRSLFSPFAYGYAPFEISLRLFRVILVPGSAFVVSFTDSLLFLCFLVVPFLF